MPAAITNDQLATGYNSLNSFVLVTGPGGAAAFISFLGEVFGGEERKAFRIPDRDGSILHAEVQVGSSSLLIADSKADWPFTPAFTQVYVDDIQAVLDRSTALGAEVVTPRSPFYNGVNIARMLDPWGNLWWLYEPLAHGDAEESADTSWHDNGPSLVYTSLMDVMTRLHPATD